MCKRVIRENTRHHAPLQTEFVWMIFIEVENIDKSLMRGTMTIKTYHLATGGPFVSHNSL